MCLSEVLLCSVHRLITYIFVYEDLSSLACGAVIIWYFAGSFEKNVGTVKHCILTAAFSVLAALLYLFLEPLVSRLLEVGDARGFMPVAFATLGVSTTRSRMKSTLLFGCRVPVVLVPWLGLCVAWFVPHSSLLGNLCGLLVGEACILSEWEALSHVGLCWEGSAVVLIAEVHWLFLDSCPALSPHWLFSCSSHPILHLCFTSCCPFSVYAENVELRRGMVSEGGAG